MILIADSGSTKTQWRLIPNQSDHIDFLSAGLNPYFSERDDFEREILGSFPRSFSVYEVEKVWFYGAGCGTKEKQDVVKLYLSKIFENAGIEVSTDILAAARALFQNNAGFAVILGTGSNVAYYNGTSIIQKTPSLGYALGDEGSGANMGNRLIKRWLYHQLPQQLEGELEKFCSLSVAQILSKIYSQKSPSQFLASFVPFLKENIGYTEVQSIVREAFRELVRNHLLCYRGFPNEPVGVIGSVGYIFQDFFEDELKQAGGVTSKFLQYPMNELATFHKNQKRC
ncbi:MAG TPA: hypothetical protein PLM76_05965 [Tenuifilaceae bacterium]|nr:hypothetical protein [Tenuifilaceae bacterium]